MRELPVLLVEDDPLVEELIRGALEDAGYRVVSVSNGSDALAALDGGKAEWAGLVTDIKLGADSSSGWDVAKHARALQASIPVVYVSGDSAHEWPTHGVPQSVMVPKPFASGQIIVALAELQNARTADI